MLIETSNIKSVGIGGRGGAVLCRITFKDGTWLELTEAGAARTDLEFDVPPVVARKSFDYDKGKKARARKRAA